MNKILLVDDEENILSAYKRTLRSKFKVYTAQGAKEGLEVFEANKPFGVVVSDYNMPGMKGIEFLAKIRSISPETVRVILTGYADVNTAINAVNEGNIFRFLTKPCPKDQLIKAIYDSFQQYQLIMSEKELLDKTLKGSIRVLIDILSVVNPSAFSQANRFSNLAKKIAVRLKIKRLWEIEIASLLSQIGCVAVPGEIIEKRNQGKELTENESEIFLSHPNIGFELLRNIPRLEKITEAIACQFYRYDGEDQPEDYKVGDSIPIISRILKVIADHESYTHYGHSNEEALEIMKKDIGAYDENVLVALESEIMGIEEGFYVKNVNIDELSNGMILAQDIKDNRGMLLIAKDNVISDVSLHRLMNYTKVNHIPEPVKVLIKS